MLTQLSNQVQNIDAMLEQILQISSGEQIPDINLLIETYAMQELIKSVNTQYQTTTILRDHNDY